MRDNIWSPLRDRVAYILSNAEKSDEEALKLPKKARSLVSDGAPSPPDFGRFMGARRFEDILKR